ncbi:SLC13 family permease [Neorhodopirellula pilleata]|uniref:Sodium-dependent dicarboxylate transporter SdcS n=1 Tax=Neorhodopirellula pilleata TaxID=2714738 RepID=A0A5C5ZKY1_9BACT|nr:SLC13 family permease [Neorhodopirellula pilleata]TWT87776.1 Sodium-dependent dicarboxylate transporter SdcS [Neorhodopirellula pilleata]
MISLIIPATWPMWLTLAVACGLLLGLAFRVAATDLLVLSSLAILVLVQDLTGNPSLPTPLDAAAGFGNKGLVTIALLFAVVTGLEMTGGTELATGWLLGGAKGLRSALIRMLIPVAALSGFLNNTPVVAALLPVVHDLAKRINVSPSRLLLPLSYAAILGGMCTLMGTSTNLLVRDLYIGKQHEFGELWFFAPAIAGIPATVLGLAYMIFASKWLLPERKPAVSVSDDPQKYTVEMQVDPTGPMVGRTIQQAGLRALPGLYVAEIQRADGRIEPAKPDQRIYGDDILILVGALDSVVDLRKLRGLITPDDQTRKLEVPAWRRTLVEAVVSPRCSLIGKTIREGKFRSNYNAAVVAVARGGSRLQGKIGDVRIRPGDVLLLEASPSFLHRQRGLSDFYLVSTVERGEVRRHEKAGIAIAITLAMVTCAALDIVSILTAALVACIAMIAFRCCTTGEARRSLDWSVLIVIGAAIGIGNAMNQSGAAGAIAGVLLASASSSPLGTLAAVFIATVICTELVTNSAAAAIMFPIAWSAAMGLGMSPEPFVVAIMIAASASFMTPFGYQTNTMVYGVGGYELRDYVVFGFPLSLLVFATSMVTLSWYYGIGF